MSAIKSTYRIDNGTGWDEYMLKTTADQVICQDGGTVEEKLNKKIVNINGSIRTGEQTAVFKIPHGLSGTPSFFFATAQSAHFIGTTAVPREIVVPTTFYVSGGNYIYINISADTNNFYVEVYRDTTLANNGWFNNLKIKIYY